MEPQPYEKAVIQSKKQIIVNNFIGGLFWALGTTVGLAVIIGILGLLAKNVDVIPYIGGFIADIVNFVQKSRGLQ